MHIFFFIHSTYPEISALLSRLVAPLIHVKSCRLYNLPLYIVLILIFNILLNLFFSGINVFRLLAWREISPRTKHLSKKLWRETSKCSVDCIVRKIEATDARHGLISW